MITTLRKVAAAALLLSASLLTTRTARAASCEYEQFRCEGGGYNGCFFTSPCQGGQAAYFCAYSGCSGLQYSGYCSC